MEQPDDGTEETPGEQDAPQNDEEHGRTAEDHEPDPRIEFETVVWPGTRCRRWSDLAFGGGSGALAHAEYIGWTGHCLEAKVRSPISRFGRNSSYRATSVNVRCTSGVIGGHPDA